MLFLIRFLRKFFITRRFQLIIASFILSLMVLFVEKEKPTELLLSYLENSHISENKISSTSKRIQTQKILIFKTENSNNKLLNELNKMLQWTRMQFEMTSYEYAVFKKASVIIFQNLTQYYKVINDPTFKNHLIKNKISVIVFSKNNQNEYFEQNIETCKLNDDNFNKESFLHLTKFNKNPITVRKRVQFNKQLKEFLNKKNYKNFKSILKCETNDNKIEDILFLNKIDEINHVFINANSLNDIWLLKPLFYDSLRYLSNGEINFSLKRYVQIDIDDIFVASSGARMVPEDVYELLKFQKKLSTKYFNHNSFKFKFNLGFCGYYYQSGSELEDEADKLLIKNRYNFFWFNHLHRHYNTHILNEEKLRNQILKNNQFADKFHLPINSNYSVVPHHSGVWPINPTLYKLWSEEFSIQATSTELYPNIHPRSLRRGFIHNNIMVAPRHSSGVFTTNLYFNSSHSNDSEFWNSKYEGGHLFETLLGNEVSIFMTHFGNYGSDRLAVYLFDNLFSFTSRWTNLIFLSLPPAELVKKYFQLNRDEREPLWINFCNSQIHLDIWHRPKSDCERLPKIIIIGPQKTGTTALYEFLKAHPNLRTNKHTVHFEETQFFNEEYLNGLDWYLDLFDSQNVNHTFLNYEKSANYFDDIKSPRRIKKLIRQPKLVAFLKNPIDRAYSWYQHVKAKNGSIAKNYSFYEILQSTNVSSEEMYQLKLRCLTPGIYYKHLIQWLTEFSFKRIYLIDSEKFKAKPSYYLNKLQYFFELETFIDYRKLMVYNKKKKFFCIKYNKKAKCLGGGKGRNYAEIDDQSRKFLEAYYKNKNKILKNLLIKYGYETPSWLN